MLSTLLVNTTTDQQDVSNGATSVGSTVSLRDAVIVASNLSGSTEIDLPAGTYHLGSVGTGELRIGNISGQNIAIKGLGTPANTIIDQTVAGSRIFNYDNNQVGTVAGSLSNVTIQGATNVNKQFGGGAILAGGPGDSLTLANCVVQNNSTSNGTLGIARNGGGIAFGANGSLTISNCVFSNNTAGGNATAGSIGGAVAFNDNSGAGVLTITNTVFNNNTATGFNSGGGAVFESGTGNFSITSSTFTNNSANSAGVASVSTGGPS